jgi:hypothetical protein
VRGSVTSGFLTNLIDLIEQLHRMAGHDGRDGVLVDQLGVAVPAKKDAEIVEPRHHTLQLDAVNEKYGERDFVFPDMVEKGVLEILRAIARH